MADIIEIGQVFPRLAMRINEGDLAELLKQGHGITAPNLVKSEEQVAEEAQAEQLAAVAADTAPGVIQEAVKQAGSASQPRK
jgi:hypothetical protein